MLTYSFNKKKGESLYEYLYNCIKNDILCGNLLPDEKLPSKRAFAANHGISIATVENTYGQLMAEGYIYSKQKSGFYVSPIQGQITAKKIPSDLIKNTNILSDSHSINLIKNHTNPEHFPFSVWAKLTRQVLNEEHQKLLTTPPPGGVMELRNAIAKHLFDFRGITVSPKQIIIGAGTEYLYGLIVQLLGRDKIYGLENPCSKKIKLIYESLGVKVASLDMDNEGVRLSPDNLTLPDIIQISPSHHFPTGIVTSISRRYGLLEWANESENRYIIEDDYDSEYRLQGRPIPSLFSIDATDKVIYFNTFTKSLASTIRISYMVLPMPLLDIFYKKLSFYACTVSNFEQYTLAKFINAQYFEKHINRMRNHYRDLRDRLINQIGESPLGEISEISEENSGLHFLLHLNTSLSEDELKEKARDKGIVVSFLSDYYSMNFMKINPDHIKTAVINYSGLTENDISIVVESLTVAWF